MAQRTINPRTIPAGPTVLGPFPIAAAWNAFDLVFDFGALVGRLDVLVEWSPDGVTWQALVQVGGAEPGVGLDRFGHDRSQLHFGASRPNGFAAGDQIRLTLNADNAFASSGGTVTTT
jgi:hypothetical protein